MSKKEKLIAFTKALHMLDRRVDEWGELAETDEPSKLRDSEISEIISQMDDLRTACNEAIWAAGDLLGRPRS